MDGVGEWHGGQYGHEKELLTEHLQVEQAPPCPASDSG